MAHVRQSSVPPDARAAALLRTAHGPTPTDSIRCPRDHPANPPGDRRPRLDRPPGDRYAPPPAAASTAIPAASTRSSSPLALVLGGSIAFVILGGILAVTAGLVVVAAFLGWLTGRLVSPPPRAAAVGLAAVVVGLLGIWLFGRIEGGVLDPIAYLHEVEGPVIVVLSLLAGRRPRGGGLTMTPEP